MTLSLHCKVHHPNSELAFSQPHPKMINHTCNHFDGNGPCPLPLLNLAPLTKWEQANSELSCIRIEANYRALQLYCNAKMDYQWRSPLTMMRLWYVRGATNTTFENFGLFDPTPLGICTQKTVHYCLLPGTNYSPNLCERDMSMTPYSMWYFVVFPHAFAKSRLAFVGKNLLGGRSRCAGFAGTEDLFGLVDCQLLNENVC